MDTLHPIYRTISSERVTKSGCYISGKWENHIKADRGKLRQSHHKPHPQHDTHNQKQTGTPELIPGEQRLWPPHLTSHILRPTSERQASKVSTFDSQWNLFPQDPQGYSYLGMQYRGRPKRASLSVKEAQLLIVKLWGLYYKWNIT